MDRHLRPESSASSSPMTWVRALVLAAAVAGTGLAVGLTAPAAAVAAPSGREMSVPLAPSAPERYVVKKGDTLWDIAGVFLKQPWYWPEIWYVNPSIANPHLIYPGDVLYLTYVDGKPRISLDRPGAVRLSPQVRTEPLANAIRAIPYDLLMKFAGRPELLEKDDVKKRPYIVGVRDRHLVAADMNEVYAQNLGTPPAGSRFTVMHVGDELHDPDTGHLLGYIGHYAGTVETIDTTGTPKHHGSMTHLAVVETGREISAGDRLYPTVVEIGNDFILSAPANQNLDGQVIAVVKGLYVAGRYQVLAINRGKHDGLVPGNAVAIFARGETVNDYTDTGPFDWRRFATNYKTVRLPDERSGTILLFRVYDHMSYGLIVESQHAMRVGDFIKHPDYGHRDVGTRGFLAH